MIPINMLNIKVDLSSEAEQINRYELPVNEFHRCRFCNSCDVVRNGKYTRNVVYIGTKGISTKRVTMQRYLCKSCKRTSTHYPSFIVRNREYSLALMFFICLSSKGRATLSKECDIPLSQVKKLRAEFGLIRKRIRTLFTTALMNNYQELTEAYQKMFLRKPFEAYQPDVHLMASIKVRYP